MTDFIRKPGLAYISWNDWVAMDQQRSAVGFLAEWLETSPNKDVSVHSDPRNPDHTKELLSGIEACVPDVRMGDASDVVSGLRSDSSALILFPDEVLAETITDGVDVGNADLCLVLWPGFDQLELWLQAHGAVQLPSGTVSEQGFLDRLPGVVRVAIQWPLEILDEASGLKHGRGKAQVVQTLQLLHREGYAYEERDLLLYAYKLGYRQRDVRKLSDYIQRIRQNRRIVTGENRLRADILKQWEAEAREL
ncbi:hypothetical protein [Arthrobacter sp. CJ23]|uniref:hypothetical protein n=1 Tax=Arthrobacter sp. CJ23 TaxID=2972479 RepID=UPI00215B9CC8|nr:hypothetical protein [Arthrobacter sp. CJ23]UVJ38030.1 hypothetical protein NVV90_12240 [Arthrobacter sp. CJ23]